jgi:hypothetical protein
MHRFSNHSPATTKRRRSLAVETLERRSVLSAAPLEISTAEAEPNSSDANISSQSQVAPSTANESVPRFINPETGLPRFRNSRNPLDVNDNNDITPFDAIPILAYIKLHGVSQPQGSPPPYLDTVGNDGFINFQDALAVLRYVAQHGVRGQSQQNIEQTRTSTTPSDEGNEPEGEREPTSPNHKAVVQTPATILVLSELNHDPDWMVDVASAWKSARQDEIQR